MGELCDRITVFYHVSQLVKWRIVRRRRRKPAPIGKRAQAHYLAHKEAARALVVERLAFHNEYYKFTWGRVAIRNTRRSWGSCSSNANLNFNYRILFLPPHLQDYLIVHELCHLKEFNHAQGFWDLVGERLPNYKALATELRAIDRGILPS